MLKNIMQQELFDCLKKDYKITKHENYFSLQEKMNMHLYIKNNNIEIKKDRNKIELLKDNKVIATGIIQYSNIISKVNNRKIPKAKLLF